MHVFTDSSAARGIMSRQGCGRLRHISGRVLWLQDFLCKWKKASLHAVPTSTNPADLFTKSLSGTRIRCLSNIIGVRDASDGFSLVGAAELEEQRRRDQAKKFLRAVKSTGRGNAEALQMIERSLSPCSCQGLTSRSQKPVQEANQASASCSLL